MTVGNQRKWDTLRPERLEIGRGLGELPEGLVVAPSPFDCVSLHLLPALQYPFPPPVEHICRCHIAQRLVIAPVVVVGHEGGKGVKGGEKVDHCGGGIVYHRHDEKGLNWEPGGVRSGAGVCKSGVSQESSGSSETWEAAFCRLRLRR